MKKVLALVLALAMVAGFAVSSFAAPAFDPLKHVLSIDIETLEMHADTAFVDSKDALFATYKGDKVAPIAQTMKGDGTVYTVKFNPTYDDLFLSMVIPGPDGDPINVEAAYKALKQDVTHLEALLAFASATLPLATDTDVAKAEIAELKEELKDAKKALATFENSVLADYKASAKIASVKSSNETYLKAVLAEDGKSFTLAFTNTTFKKAEGVTLTLTLEAEMNGTKFTEELAKYYFDITEYTVNTKKFDKVDAAVAFAAETDVTIMTSAADSVNGYDVITADAFKVLLANAKRTLTVVGKDFKVKFDSESENLNQDVIISTMKSSNDGEKVTFTAPATTATAKVKVAVGKDYYNTFYGKKLVAYVGGKAVEGEVVLQGDYSVNFVGALGNYEVAGTDFGKTNPAMGSNDFVGAAIALASLSLAAAGAVALKKSK